MLDVKNCPKDGFEHVLSANKDLNWCIVCHKDIEEILQDEEEYDDPCDRDL